MKKYIKFTDAWIEKHGNLPANYEIIHIDGDHKNNDFANLKVIDKNDSN